MRFNLRLIAHATFTSIMLAGATGTAVTNERPDYMQPIAGRTTSTPAETATKNLLALNSSMIELYGDAATTFALSANTIDSRRQSFTSSTSRPFAG